MALPAARLFGGNGNDTVISGSGDDLMLGQGGMELVRWVQPGKRPLRNRLCQIFARLSGEVGCGRQH
jgi:hypothetical protein